MTIVLWPTFLQDLINQSGFNYTFGKNTVESKNDTGVAKKRKRFTKRVDNLSVSLTIDYDTYVQFDDFYETSLNSGVNYFYYDHPLTGVQGVYQIIGEPAISSLGGRKFNISMAWREIPQ